MATVKKTLSLDADAWAFAEQAAKAAGLSPSAWVSRAARQQAILDAYRSSSGEAEVATLTGDAEAVAVADEAEAAAAEEEWRAAG